MISNQYRKWIINCALGELLGIGIAGAFAVAVNYFVGEPQSLTEKLIVLIIMLAAGTVEGSSIAFFQWKVLRHVFPQMRLSAWWKWTVLIAVLGWGAGMLPSLFFAQPATGTMPEPSIWFIAVIAAGSGAAAGALFGLFQSVELKKHSRNWKWWIVANMLAWAVAMLIIFIGATWPSAATPVGFIIISAVVSGCLAGLSLGVVTGYFLFKFIVTKKQAMAVV